MKHPGGSRGERWKPLALWVGWTRAEWPTVLFIMDKRGGWGESGGNPRAKNRKWPFCRGLMQLAYGFYTGAWKLPGIRQPFDPYDPLKNLQAAEAIHDLCGWKPWAVAGR